MSDWLIVGRSGTLLATIVVVVLALRSKSTMIMTSRGAEPRPTVPQLTDFVHSGNKKLAFFAALQHLTNSNF